MHTTPVTQKKKGKEKEKKKGGEEWV